MLTSVLSCKTATSTTVQKSNAMEKVEYVEARRLNKNIGAKDVFVLENMDDITALYTKFQNPGMTRQAPIPTLEADESMLIINPKPSASNPYADIEVESLSTKGNQLIVNYKEVENGEYSANKESHPVLVLIVKAKPKSVVLKKLK